jgi:carbonic anhydrase/acetyltransferase-like protein (isoleucine patch superfamily)
VVGTSNLVGDVSMNSKLIVGNDVSFNSKLFVGGTSNLVGDVSMNSKLIVGNDVSFNSKLFVVGTSNLVGDVSMNAKLIVGNDVSLNSKLFVVGTSNLVDDVSMNSKLIVGNDVSFNGKLFVVGTSNLLDDVSMNSKLIVGNDVSFNSKLFVVGTSNLVGDVSMNSKLIVGNDVSFNSKLFVVSTSNLVGDVSMNAKLIVGNDVSMNAKLFVQGTSNLVDDVSMNSKLIVGNDVSLNSKLFVVGTSNLVGDVSMNSKLIVGNDVSLNSKLFVVGTSNLVGDVSINANLNVGGLLTTNDIIPIGNCVANIGDPTHWFGNLYVYDLIVGPNSIKIGDSSITSDEGTINIPGNFKTDGTFSAHGDVSFGSNLFVHKKTILYDDVSINKNVDISGSLNVITNFKLPVGGTDKRPTTINETLSAGYIRYNTDNHQFEGYGPGNSWGSLGGVINVAQNTKITASSPDPDSTNNELQFYTAPTGSVATGDAVERMRILANGDISMNSKLIVGNDVSLNSKLFVNTTTNLVGDVSMNSKLIVGDDVSLNSKLFVATTTNLVGDVSMNSKLIVGNDVSLNSKLFVQGTTNLVGDVSMNSKLIVGNDVSLNSKLFVQGTSNLVDDVSMNNKLIVGNDVSFNGKLFVVGTSNLVGDVSMNNKLIVGNDVSLNRNIDVSGSLNVLTNLKLPVGGTSARPTTINETLSAGYIRYNTDNHQFEGYGPGNSWGSLGGVVNVAQNTKIIASSPNPDSTNNELQFYTAPTGSLSDGDAVERMRVLASGDISMNYKLFIQGDVSMNSKLRVSNDVLMNSKLVVGGDVSINSNLFVGGNVTINEKLFVNELEATNFSITGTMTYINVSQLDVSDNLITLNKGGLTSAYSGIEIESGGSIAAYIKLDGTEKWTIMSPGQTPDYIVTKASIDKSDFSLNEIRSRLEQYSYNLSDTTAIDRNVVLSNSGYKLSVLGDASLNTKLFVNGDVSLNNKLTVKSDVSLNSKLSVASDVSFGSKLFIQGISTMAGDVSINANLFVNGDVSFNSKLTVNSDVSLNSKLYVASDVSFGSKLFIQGVSTMMGDVSINSNLFVSENVSFDGKFDVINDVNLHSKLTVNGITTNVSDVSMNAKLRVDGDVSLNSKLSVANTLTMTNDASIVLKNSSSSIIYPDATAQISAYTGAGALAGIYSNPVLTIDSQGRIVALSNGVYVGMPFYQASIITNNAYPPIINMGWGNYNNWNSNIFTTFRVSITIIYGTNYVSVHSLNFYLNIYPNRLISSSQTPLNYQINNLETNAINGNISHNYIDSTYAPNGRYFWAHGMNSTGNIGNGYIQIIISSGGFWGFQIKNPNVGNPCIISMTVEQTNKSIGGTLTLENISGYDSYYNQGFGALTMSGYSGLPYYQASLTTVVTYPIPITVGWSNYASWNPYVFSTFKVSISVVYGTNYINVYTLDCYLNVYPYRLASASQTSLSSKTNDLDSNAINGNISFSYIDPTYAPYGRYFWTHGINSKGTLNAGYLQMVITAGGRWGFQIKNPNPGNSCIINISVEQVNRAIGGTLALDNIPFGYDYSTQGFMPLSLGGYVGMPFYQASTTTYDTYPAPINLGFSNYTSWNQNLFATFKISLTVIYGINYASFYSLNCYIDIYPYRLASASQTPANVQINNLETNAINGNTSFSYINATYAPNGRYFWAHEITPTGTMNDGYVQLVISTGGCWGFQIKNPNPGSPCFISMMVEQTNKAIGGPMSLVNFPFGYDYYTQGFD